MPNGGSREPKHVALREETFKRWLDAMFLFV
jgi:hypothetical protein